MSEPLVWLPFDPAELGQVPAGLRYEVVNPTRHVPESVTDVAFYVTPYAMGPEVADVLEQMSSLQVVQTLSAGVDNIRDRVPEGVTLCNGRGIHDTSTAELALALILASLRELPRFVRQQERGEWHRAGFTEALADKQVLIVGYGSIGAAIESRLTPFEVDVVRVARTAREGVHGIDELPALLPSADVVVLIVPLTDDTRGLVGEEFLAGMKPGALLVNMARGAVVDTGALVAALRAGQVRAALDVTDPEPLPPGHPLWSAPGLLLSPHTGGASTAMWPRARRLVRQQLERFAAGEPLANVMSDAY
jgi:phosphoglycerate dehydrogenase-like enzyme